MNVLLGVHDYKKKFINRYKEVLRTTPCSLKKVLIESKALDI